MKSSEKILICLSGSPSNAKVISEGAKLAEAFGGALAAVFVKPSDFQRWNGDDIERLNRNIALAESYGAQVTTLFGEDAATQVAEYARISCSTKIVLGKSAEERRLFSSGDIMKRLAEFAPDIDIFIIPDNSRSPRRRRIELNTPGKLNAGDILKTVLILALCTINGKVFMKINLSATNVILVYTLGVLAVAMLTSGRTYSVSASFLSVVIYNFFFVEPIYSLRADSEQAATFIVMLVSAFLISSLTTEIKNQAIRSARWAYRTELLLQTNQKLQKADNEQAILSLTASQMGKLLERKIVLYPADMSGAFLPVCSCDDGSSAVYEPDSAEAEQAARAIENGKILSESDVQAADESIYCCIRGAGEKALGAVSIRGLKEKPLDSFDKNLTGAMLDECGIILENLHSMREKREAEEQVRIEELRANLLKSISHDLRTPLTGISGNAALLMSSRLDEEKRREIYAEIYDDSAWLIDLVENLLSMTRISEGNKIVKPQPELLSEIFAEALKHTDSRRAEHSVSISLPDDYLMADMDARLIMQVIINLVNNAVRYTPAGSEISLSAAADGDKVLVKVSDTGPGISDDVKEKVFDLFYTSDSSQGDKSRGIGLGLALCKSIVLAHGSELTVEDNKPRGTVFSFRLPRVEVKLDEQA